MNPATESFNQLLEHYIFNVANQHIESADSATQTAMIRLWQTVSEAATPDGSLPASHTPQSAEWEAVLQKPVNWRSINQHWLQGIVRTRRQQHAQYVSRLNQAIESTLSHLEAVQASPLPEQMRIRLSAYYQRTLLMYQQQLAHAERIHNAYFASATLNGR